MSEGIPEPSADRPEWLPEQFRTVEDAARSYVEAQKEMNRAQTDAQRAREEAEQWQEYAANLEQQYQEASTQQQQAQSYDPYMVEQSPILQSLRNARENDDLATELGIQANMLNALAQNAAQQAMQQYQQQQPQHEDTVNMLMASKVDELLGMRYGPEWEQLRDEVGELAVRAPHLVPNTNNPMEAAEALSIVVDAVRARNVQNEYAGQQVDFGTAMKRQAQGVQGSGQPPVNQANDDAAVLQRIYDAKLTQFKVS